MRTGRGALGAEAARPVCISNMCLKSENNWFGGVETRRDREPVL